MMIESEHNFGDTVYLKTDRDQHERIVVEVIANPMGVRYRLACGTNADTHYEIEISKVKNVMLSTTN